MEMLEISQADLAKRSGLTDSAIAQILKGKRDPSLTSVLKLLSALPVTFERLITKKTGSS